MNVLAFLVFGAILGLSWTSSWDLHATIIFAVFTILQGCRILADHVITEIKEIGQKNESSSHRQ